MLRSYFAYLTFKRLPAESFAVLRQLFKTHGLEPGITDITESILEFESSGRDASRRVVSVFREAAEIIGEAEGELRCEVDDAQEDPHFEFFRILGGKLYRQTGVIVRSTPPMEVDDAFFAG